jgi:hypothetical protein
MATLSASHAPRTSCRARGEIMGAAGMVNGYAFSEVKPVTCSGSTYTFQAMRRTMPT